MADENRTFLGKGQIGKLFHGFLKSFRETEGKSETRGKYIIASEGMDATGLLTCERLSRYVFGCVDADNESVAVC